MQAGPVAATPAPSIALALLGVAIIVVAASWVAGHPGQVIALGGRWRSVLGVGRARDRLGAARWPQVLAAVALILVLGVALLVLVVWTLGAIGKSAPVAGVDRPLYDWFVSHRAGWATTVMNGITGVGSYTATAAVAAVAGVGLALSRREALPLLLLVTVPLERYLQQGIGALVQAPRPPAALSIGPVGGFPSGGSARVVLVGGMVAWLLARRTRAWRPAVAGWAVVALVAFAQGYSRLYLGRHWVADVVGGWVFGALLVAVLVAAATVVPLPSGRRWHLASPGRGWAAACPGRGHPETHDRS